MIQIPNTLNMFIDLETNEVYKNGIKLAYADHYRLEFNNLVIKRSIEWIRHFTILNIKIHPDYVYALKFLKFKEFKPFGVSKAYNMLPIFSKPRPDELNNLVFPSNFRRNVILKNVDTNEELKFSSIRKASYFTKRDQKTIVKYIDLKIPMVTNKGTFLVHFIDM